MATKTTAKDLKPGNIIPPPSGERRWLWKDGTKRMMTVLDVVEDGRDARGPWICVRTSCSSPYGPADFKMACRMRPDSIVTLQS